MSAKENDADLTLAPPILRVWLAQSTMSFGKSRRLKKWQVGWRPMAGESVTSRGTFHMAARKDGEVRNVVSAQSR